MFVCDSTGESRISWCRPCKLAPDIGLAWLQKMDKGDRICVAVVDRAGGLVDIGCCS